MKRTKWTRAAAILFTLALALVMIGLPATALANVTGLSFTVASPQHVLVGGTVTLTRRSRADRNDNGHRCLQLDK